jgi:V-type H+-transporting ATPase subunit C
LIPFLLPSLSSCLQPDTKSSSKLLKSLSSHYSHLASKSDPARRPKKAASKGEGKPATQEEMGGDWANVLEEEWLDYVLFEVPRVV